jgi:hypothetical protein
LESGRARPRCGGGGVPRRAADRGGSDIGGEDRLGSSSSQLKILRGAASVIGFVLTDNNGDDVIDSGTAGATACTAFWVLNGVVVDSPTGATTVSITAGGTPVWSGTAAAGGHLDDTFDGGVSSAT